ncbi:hypothetical protein ACFX5U_10700 [Sphingobacterium sp. SG20118]|uniref:hypothetical protein n=1 Tax=Sphingobacterium sp. SG20118 TaxID=3367156 RepID=UPI0037DFC681
MHLVYNILIILVAELLLSLAFWIFTPQSVNNKKFDLKSTVKGVLERLFMTYSLCQGFPHVLTLFGALKLGTRLKRAEKEDTPENIKKEAAYNDYYLIGNLISVALSIFYYSLFK